MTELTLADFLLARYVEDEAPTWRFARYVCPPGCCAPAGWVGSQCLYCDAAPVYGGTVKAMTEIAERHAEDIHQRSRVLAEHGPDRGDYFGHEPADWCGCCGAEYLVGYPCDTLRLLALPYADRPGYHEEWRP